MQFIIHEKIYLIWIDCIYCIITYKIDIYNTVTIRAKIIKLSLHTMTYFFFYLIICVLLFNVLTNLYYIYNILAFWYLETSCSFRFLRGRTLHITSHPIKKVQHFSSRVRKKLANFNPKCKIVSNWKRGFKL